MYVCRTGVGGTREEKSSQGGVGPSPVTEMQGRKKMRQWGGARKRGRPAQKGRGSQESPTKQAKYPVVTRNHMKT